MITWDIEGQEFAHATTYVGDPRALDTLARKWRMWPTKYFARFRDAGLRTGICIRPQLLRLAPDKASAAQVPTADPAELLMDKIAYAKKRWSASLFYIDSNVNPDDPNPLDASVMQKVAAAFPDCLLIPEHATLRYYAYSMPFRELRHGLLTTPDLVREIYPNAATAIYTADGPLDYYHDALKSAVKRGDTLIYRTWYRDPQNDKVRTLLGQSIYAEAPAERRSLGRLLLSGSSALGAATLVERGLGFAANLAAARLGGAHVFGAYSVAMTTANNVASYAGAGIGTTANRFSGEYPYGKPGYASLLSSLAMVSLGSAALQESCCGFPQVRWRSIYFGIRR